MKNTYYKHYKNKQKYIVLGVCQYQHNNVWYDAVMYQSAETGKISVMQENEFDKEHSIWNKK